MIITAKVTPQEVFPVEDLNEDNSNALELMLANLAIVADGCSAAEDSSWAFRVGHPAIVKASERSFDESTRVEAVKHGVMVFEAMTVAVNGSMSHRNDTDSVLAVNGAVADVLKLGENNRLPLYCSDAIEEFTTEMPNATETIKNASERFFGHHLDYVVAGAALERQIVLARLKDIS